jgi:enamine deaminase RidA (YjgF/YER057c/UK114 family)
MEDVMDSDRRELVKTAIAGAAGMMGAELLLVQAAQAQTGAVQPKFLQHEPPRSYAKACVFGNLIFLAGEDSKDPKTQEVRGANSEEQTEILFQSMDRTLKELGSSLAHVIKTTTLLADARHQPGYSKAKAKYLPHRPPGTSIAGVQLADPRMLVEIEAIAYIPG